MKGKHPAFSRLLFVLGGAAAGILNGLLGAGGGTAAVPVFRKSGLEEAPCHATSVAVILPLCVLSAGIYLYRGDVTLADALPYLPWMLGGALSGAGLLPRCRAVWLRRSFGLLMLWAGGRMLF